MRTQEIEIRVKSMVVPAKGTRSMDESNPTCGRRLEAVGVANTEANRRAYRSMLLGTDGLGEYISGAVLYGETILGNHAPRMEREPAA